MCPSLPFMRICNSLEHSCNILCASSLFPAATMIPPGPNLDSLILIGISTCKIRAIYSNNAGYVLLFLYTKEAEFLLIKTSASTGKSN